MNKILVTGGCGYIGSHTIVDLIENGYEVISIDNFSNSYPSALDNIKKITGKEVLNYDIDICDLDKIKLVFQENQNIVGVIHFAAHKAVNESLQFPLKYYRNNILGLLNILDCCKSHNIENFVFSSSCSVYGNAKELPVNEFTPLAKSESPYAETKVMAERIIQDFSNDTKFKSTLLRYFNPIGAHVSGFLGENPKQDPQNIMPRLTGTAKGVYKEFKVYGNDYDTSDGSCIRDYIHVSDIANAHTLAIDWLLKKVTPVCEVLNIGSGDGVSVLELISAFENGSGQKLNHSITDRRLGDVVAIYANNDKARKVIKWNPKYSLFDMMETSWKWDLNK